MAKTKSETFSVRLEPKTRYLAELAARSQGRSLANFIQMAVERALENTEVQTYARPNQAIPVLSSEFVELVWDVDEPERLVKLALAYPELMTFDEQVIYKRLLRDYLMDDARAPYTEHHFDWPRISTDWKQLKEPPKSV